VERGGITEAFVRTANHHAIQSRSLETHHTNHLSESLCDSEVGSRTSTASAYRRLAGALSAVTCLDMGGRVLCPSLLLR
jgi:hypothetical protein